MEAPLCYVYVGPIDEAPLGYVYEALLGHGLCMSHPRVWGPTVIIDL